MIDWRNLIATSRLLVNTPGPSGETSEESLRRAVSTAYYAMFHALAASNADSLLGSPQYAEMQQAWNRAYRGMDHGAARRNLTQNVTNLTQASRQFIRIFALLQDARHRADYDPDENVTLQYATGWIDSAEEAIEGFMSAPVDERKAVAIRALVRERST